MKQPEQPAAMSGKHEKSHRVKVLLIRMGVILGLLALVEIITIIVQVSRPPV